MLLSSASQEPWTYLGLNFPICKMGKTFLCLGYVRSANYKTPHNPNDPQMNMSTHCRLSHLQESVQEATSPRPTEPTCCRDKELVEKAGRGLRELAHLPLANPGRICSNSFLLSVYSCYSRNLWEKANLKTRLSREILYTYIHT